MTRINLAPGGELTAAQVAAAKATTAVPVDFASGSTDEERQRFMHLDELQTAIGAGAPEGTAVLSTGEAGGTKFLREDGDGTCSWQTPAGGDVVSDTTPQLGGNLDVNGQSIVSASAGDIAITPDTTGDVILDGQKWPQADGSANQLLTTDGAGQLSWATKSPISHRLKLHEWSDLFSYYIEPDKATWSFRTAGGSTSGPTDRTGHPGNATLSSGTTAGSHYGGYALNGYVEYADNVEFECIFSTTAYSGWASSDCAVAKIGLFQTYASATDTHGYYLRFAGTDENSAKCQLYTKNGGSANVVDTGITLSDWTFYRVRITRVSTTVTLTLYSISGTVLYTGSTTTEVPATSQALYPGCTVQKSSGSTSRTLELDFIEVMADLSGTYRGGS